MCRRTHRPSRPSEPIAEVELLEEQEVRRVETANGVERSAADKHAGTLDVSHFSVAWSVRSVPSVRQQVRDELRGEHP